MLSVMKPRVLGGLATLSMEEGERLSKGAGHAGAGGPSFTGVHSTTLICSFTFIFSSSWSLSSSCSCRASFSLVNSVHCSLCDWIVSLQRWSRFSWRLTLCWSISSVLAEVPSPTINHKAAQAGTVSQEYQGSLGTAPSTVSTQEYIPSPRFLPEPEWGEGNPVKPLLFHCLYDLYLEKLSSTFTSSVTQPHLKRHTTTLTS